MAEGPVRDALRELVGRAVQRHGLEFGTAFPTAFDWEAVCREAPALARRGGGRPPTDVEGEALVRGAAIWLRLGFVGGLAILAARDPDEPDAEGALDALVDEWDEDDEPAFGALVGDHLDAIEGRLAGRLPAGGEGSESLATIAALAWEPLEAWCDASPPATHTAWRGLLVGYARLGAALAALRWHLRSRP